MISINELNSQLEVFLTQNAGLYYNEKLWNRFQEIFPPQYQSPKLHTLLSKKWHSISDGEKEIIKQILSRQLKICVLSNNIYKTHQFYDILAHYTGFYSVPYELTLRMLLQQNATLPLKKMASSRENQRWVRKFQEEHVDFIFQSFPKKINIDINTSTVILNLQNSCCGYQGEFNIKSKANEFLCPECLAKCQIDNDSLVPLMIDYFWNFVNHVTDGGTNLSPTTLRSIQIISEAMRPYLFIRFGYLRTERIGHQVINACQWRARKEAGHIPKSLDILGETPKFPIANPFLHSMWERFLTEEGDVVFHPIGPAMGKFLSLDNEHSLMRILNSPTYGDFTHSRNFDFSKVVQFTQSEINEANIQLRQMGIPTGSPYICLHLRTGHYLQQQLSNIDSSYHNHRDTIIQNYHAAIQWLTSQGYYVIRMGAAKDLPKLENPPDNYIDYANLFRSDFMDIYLSVNCKYMISTSSGVDMIPIMLNKPILCPDFAENYMLGLYSEFIHHCKTFTRDGKIIGLKEQLTTQINRLNQHGLDAKGIKVHNNSPESLLELFKHMESLINKEFEYTEDQQIKLDKVFELQSRNPAFFYTGQSKISPETLDKIGFDL